jgi:DNA polymerase-3 subunit epsilon
VSPSLYGFVGEREPVSPEEIATDFLSLSNPNGDARALAEALIAGDPRFVWDAAGALCTADVASLPPTDAPYVVFDVETTGSSAGKGGITEIGAVKLVGGQVVDELSTLVNPGRKIEPFVVRLTGITDRMVANAPTPAEVMPLFEEFAEGSILVGHNVHFDNAFVAAAREAAGLPSLPNRVVLDTLKLARVLVPGLKRYRLSSLVAHFGVRAAPNHRALADAAATAGVLVKLLKLLGSAGVSSVGEAATLRASRGPRIEPQKGHLADGLPCTPGVYYFVDKDGTVLYVGKAKDLKGRVKTYFNGGDGRRKVGRLVREVAEVRHTETGTELCALILESREIKRLLPRYNSAGRGDKATWFIELDTNEPYPVPERVAREEEARDGIVRLGPYRSAGVLDACMEALGRIFPLRRCDGDGDPCFYGQMGRCAPCLGMGPEEYRTRVVDGISALLRGEGGEEHLAALVAERRRLAEALEFEAAARLRDLISGIERVRLARAAISAEGVMAVVAPSTEPGIVEVFALSGGRLVAHEGFEPADEAGLKLFARGVLAARDASPNGEGADEARVVAAYLRRQGQTIEAVRLGETGDLLAAVGRAAPEPDEKVGA